MSTLDIVIIISVIITLSFHSYLLPLFGTGQYPYPILFNLLQKIQAFFVLTSTIMIFGWIIGLIIGIVLAFWSAAIFSPAQVLLHLLHGIDLTKQPIPMTIFEWDRLTIIINFFWLLSFATLFVLILISLIG